MVLVFPVQEVFLYLGEVSGHIRYTYLGFLFQKKFLQYHHTRIYSSVAVYDELAIEKRHIVLHFFVYEMDIQFSRIYFFFHLYQGIFKILEAIIIPPDIIDRQEIDVFSPEGMGYERDVFFEKSGILVLDHDVYLVIYVI